MTIVFVKRNIFNNFKIDYGKPVQKAVPIILGPKQIRPDGVRQPGAEANIIADQVMLKNGMSGNSI